MIYTSLPAFQDNDIVSASRLNQVADNLDICAGMECVHLAPYDSGADSLTNGGCWTRDNGYPGFAGKRLDLWIAHNGDQIKVYHGGVGTPTNAQLWYDYEGANQQGPYVVAPSAERTITINAAPFYQFQPVRLRIQQNDINSAPSLYLRYLYQTDSNRPTSISVPAFANGTTSNAADFNAILSGTEQAYNSFNQPVPAFGHMPYVPRWIPSVDGGAKGGLVAWVQHRHSNLYFDAVLQGPTSTGPDDYAYLRYNDQTIWQITLSNNGTGTGPKNPGNGKYRSWDGQISIDLAGQGLTLTSGTWYKVEFYYHRLPDADRGQNAAVWAIGERQDNYMLSAPLRWQHGSIVNGDTDNPKLRDFTTTLSTLSSKLRWYNAACRGASSRMVPDWSDNEVVDQFGTYRVHRWLAYENFALVPGERANAQIQWRTGTGRTLQSYSLPTAETPSFFDLDSTPVKSGMYMRISGVKFAIQVPQPGEYDNA